MGQNPQGARLMTIDSCVNKEASMDKPKNIGHLQCLECGSVYTSRLHNYHVLDAECCCGQGVTEFNINKEWRADRNSIMHHFSWYDFHDPIGHPLTHCMDFIDIIDELLALRQEVKNADNT